MSARAKTMLQMALKLSGQEKESNVQPTDSPDTDQQSITEVQQEIENPANINVYTNFLPIIQNESTITIVEGRSDSDINDLLNSFPEPQECFETENEQFDDSDVDPNYVPSESDEPTSDSEIELMAAEIENNLQNDTQAKLKEKYLRKIKQNKRNHGKPYDTKSGKKVSERRCTPLAKCRKLCQTKISFEQQKAIFDQYWNLGSYKQRILFISGLLRVEDKKTQKMNKSTTAPRNRNHSVYYYLEIGTQLIHVCHRCFRCCFGETDSFLKSVVKKKLNLTLTDHRGIATPSNKVSDDKVNAVKVHIESFPAYESHYTRRDTSQKYFHADLTLGKIYQLYCEKQSDPISLSKFSNIFKEMNIKFKAPKTDTCNQCSVLKAKIDITTDQHEIEILKLEQSTHHIEADLGFKSKENDKKLSVLDPTLKVYSFDLQQCLPTPFLQTSISFYKRQLWTYNLTVHDGATNVPYCFMWHEAVAGRGGNDIASCIYRHLATVPQNVRTVTLYSDNCAGQNKNSFLPAMFMIFLENNEHITTINHKFLTPGHTHMECDSDHSVIERKKRKTGVKIHHPHDWYQFVRTCGTSKSFNVIEMEQEIFFDFSSALKGRFMPRKVNQDGEKFIWREVKWLRYSKEHFGCLEYKATLNEGEPFKKLNFRRRGVNTFKLSELKNAYSMPLCISKEKKKDLLDLLPLIDPNFHAFYKNLPVIDMPNIHPDLVEDEEPSDF